MGRTHEVSDPTRFGYSLTLDKVTKIKRMRSSHVTLSYSLGHRPIR
jgi:hypothetical protein